MKLSFKNSDLKKTSEFLSDVELTGKSSRARVKLNERLSEKLTDFSVEFQHIKQSFDELKEQEKYEDLKEQIAQMNELTAEKSVIDMGEYEHLLSSLKTDLEDYPHVLNGDKAIAHDLLLDELEGDLIDVEEAIVTPVEQAE